MRHEPVGAGLTSCQPGALQGQEQHRAALGWGQDYRETKTGSQEADNAGVVFPISHLHFPVSHLHFPISLLHSS